MPAVPETFVAVDLGAGSGRVILGRFAEDRFHHEVLHRFPNRVERPDNHERWNTGILFREILEGLRRAGARKLPVASVGVDSWGVDFGLLDSAGRLIEEPVFYRDRRTQGRLEDIFRRVPRESIYRTTGIQFMEINSLVQLRAQVEDGEFPPDARILLMIADLFQFFLSGNAVCEYTNASTTQLLNVRSRRWDEVLLRALDLPLAVMPELVGPGTVLGPLDGSVLRRLNLPGTLVVAPATHDTASAVAGTPLGPGSAYISSGTWSLVGIESTAPVLNDLALSLNCSNEGGVGNTIRFLKNVMGLWILESCRSEWESLSGPWPHDRMFAEIESAPPSRSFINPDDPAFLNPPRMLSKLSAFLERTGQPVPESRAAIARCILDSLALRYVDVLEALESAAGVSIARIHIVGGGSQNSYLNQAAADASGLPVEAGPVEATSIGNLLVQALAARRFSTLAEGRAYVRRHAPIACFEPRNKAWWQDARARFHTLTRRHGKENPPCSPARK
ncbi:MAG: rhamnulokinase family protein [Planctomycetota bacterium]